MEPVRLTIEQFEAIRQYRNRTGCTLRQAKEAILAGEKVPEMSQAPLLAKLAAAEASDRESLEMYRRARDRADEKTRQVTLLREALQRAQYRSPGENMVPECVGCGALGPVDDGLRKLPPEPCMPYCYIDKALKATE